MSANSIAFKLIVIFFLLINTANAQKQNYINYTKESGLAGNTAYCIAQDKDGFIWIGTENGASRFDGNAFKTFTVEDGLTDNEVLELFADSKGRIWFICYTGKICYYYKGIIYNENNDPVLKKASNVYNLTKIIEDTDGNIWFRSEYIGVYTIDGNFKVFNGGKVTDFKMPFASVSVFNPNYEFGGINIVINSQVHNLRADTVIKTGWFTVNISKYPELDKIPANLISLTAENHSIIYGRNFYSLLVKNTNKGFELQNCKTGIAINKVKWDEHTGEFWITIGNNGAFRVNKVLQPTTDSYFPDKNLTDAITDKDGNIWFTSPDEGVLKVDYAKSEIFDSESGLVETKVVSIKNINGNIIAGTYDGNLYQKKGNRFERIFINKRDLIKTGQLRNITSNNNFLLIQYNTELQVYPMKRFSILNEKYLGAIKSVSHQSDTSIYVASHIGLFHASESKIDTVTYRERFTALSNSIDNKIWAASTKNLYLVRGLKLEKNSLYNILQHGRIADMIYNKSGALWISTYSHGLYLINKSRLIKVDKSRGLASNQCRTLFSNKNGELWVVTNTGFSRITFSVNDPDSLVIENYDQSDGFPECNIAQLTSLNDTLWLATNSGVVSFFPGRDRKKKLSAIQITEVKQDNTPVSVNNSSNTHKGNTLQITYSSIMFNSNKNIVFSYFLEGLDVNWNTTTQRQIEYASLAPGDYTFKVYATDKNGNRSNNTALYKFTVLPLWWQTWWFKIVVASAVSGLIFLIYKRRIEKIKSTEREKLITVRRMSELKLEALRSQLNPHFIFNSLNAIQNYLIEHDAPSASGYLNEFSKVIRKSLQLSMSNFVPLKEETELLDSFLKLERMRFDYGFDYTIQLEPELNFVYVPTLVFQHYAENAVKHGIRGIAYRGIIDISFSTLNGMILCVIEDNGRGLKQKKEFQAPGTGLGLQLQNSRSELLNLTYNLSITIKLINRSDEDPSVTGTRVEIKLPLLTSREMELKQFNDTNEPI